MTILVVLLIGSSSPPGETVIRQKVHYSGDAQPLVTGMSSQSTNGIRAPSMDLRIEEGCGLGITKL